MKEAAMTKKKGTGTWVDEMKSRWTATALLTLALVVSACDGTSPTAPGPPDNGPVTRFVQEVSGNHQVGVPGEALAAPFRVRVVDTGGRPLADVGVLWIVREGDGEIRELSERDHLAPSTLTSADGIAEVTLILGDPGRNVVQASPSLFSFENGVLFEATGA